MTLAHSAANDLTAVTDPTGGLRSFTYDGTYHLLRNDQWGPRSVTYTYDSSNSDPILRQMDQGLGSVTTYAPLVWQAVNASPAVNANQAAAVVTDALGHATTITMDTGARATKTQTPDGATWSAQLGLNDLITAATDPLGRVTTLTYDIRHGNSENLVQQVNPDGSTLAWSYSQDGYVVQHAERAVDHDGHARPRHDPGL